MHLMRILVRVDILVIGLLLALIGLPDYQYVSAQHQAFHGTKTVAGFHIELTVEPMTIEPGTLTKFGTKITSAETGEPVEKVPHTFVLMKDDKIIFKESTDSANTIHEFTFTEEHKGSLTVIIENVNSSGESIEFNLAVIPEFTTGVALLIITAMLATAIAVLRLKAPLT